MAHIVETGETVNLTAEAVIPHSMLDSINQSRGTSGMAVNPIIKSKDITEGLMTSRTAEDAITLNINHSR